MLLQTLTTEFSLVCFNWEILDVGSGWSICLAGTKEYRVSTLIDNIRTISTMFFVLCYLGHNESGVSKILLLWNTEIDTEYPIRGATKSSKDFQDYFLNQLEWFGRALRIFGFEDLICGTHTRFSKYKTSSKRDI